MCPQDPVDLPVATPAGERSVRPGIGSRSPILRLLYNHNPFYLLSTAFVLHGSAAWMQHAGIRDPWPLIWLTAGYILMMAGTAIVIVRAGGVWEDARSILLLIPVLFVELSLAFDSPLINTRQTGTLLAVGGFLFSSALCEGLLLGLRIRLPAAFRLPLHALLGLVFLYPLVLVSAIDAGHELTVLWRIWLFYPVVGLVLLTLLPAVRRGPRAIVGSGTPWTWPAYPWSLYVVLLATVCFRGFALGLSFDPVMSLGAKAALEQASVWGAWFLVPVGLAVAVLLLEAGLLAGNRTVQAIAVAVPAACVLLVFPWAPPTAPQAVFLTEFTKVAASPLFLTVAAATVFFAIAWARAACGAETAFTTCLLLLAAIEPKSLTLPVLSTPQPLALLVVASLLLTVGLLTGSSRRTLFGAMLAVGAVVLGPLASGPDWAQRFIPVQLAGLAVFAVGRQFDDRFARWLRPQGAMALLCCAVLSLPTLLPAPAAVPVWAVPAYLLLLIGLTLAAAYPLRSMLYFGAGIAGLAIFLAESIWRVLVLLRESPGWHGFDSFLIAFGLFVIGAGVSAAKAGLGRRLAVLLPGSRPDSREP